MSTHRLGLTRGGPVAESRPQGGGMATVRQVQVTFDCAEPERLAALESECARPTGPGATRVRLLVADGTEESCLVMRDIEGNEFCLD